VPFQMIIQSKGRIARHDTTKRTTPTAPRLGSRHSTTYATATAETHRPTASTPDMVGGGCYSVGAG
jgi:hypothetical protein